MKTFLVIALIFAGSLLSWAETEAHSNTTTTVTRVYWHKTSDGGVLYCNIALRNGRTLEDVEAGLCNSKPRGSRITLVYDAVQVDDVQCDWLGRCKTVIKTVYNLVSWY